MLLNKETNRKIYDFYFFKLSEKFTVKLNTKSFRVNKDNVSLIFLIYIGNICAV